ncbi:hypothetical protein ACVDHI_00425 [Aeromonas sp. 25-248]
MLTEDELRTALITTSRQHITLTAKYSEFAENLEHAFGSPNSEMKGLSVRRIPDTSTIEINFVGISLRLIFSTVIRKEEPNRNIGIVRCYSLETYPEEKSVEVGGFTFKPNGDSDLIDPAEDEPFNITHHRSAWHIGMHLIHQALIK